MTISIVLAEDNLLVREGALRLLDGMAEISVLAACDDLDTTLAAIGVHQPDVVLTDIRMPPTNTTEGLKVADECRRHHPTIGVLLLSQYVEVGYVRSLLEHGTERRGYLLKERIGDPADLLRAIREVHAGGSAFDSKVIEALVSIRTSTHDPGLARLSPRERQVLGCIARGHTNASIAEELFLTRHAVEKHINSIFIKLGLSGSEQHHPRVRAALLYLAEVNH